MTEQHETHDDNGRETPGEVPDVISVGAPGEISRLFVALCKAKLSFAPIRRTKEVQIRSAKGNYRFSYAPLDTLKAATERPLLEHGLTIVSFLGRDPDGRRKLVVRLVHADGQGCAFLQSVIEIPDATSIKDFGSNVTYLRRYAYSCLLDLVADDDLDSLPEPARGETSSNEIRDEDRPPQPPEAPPKPPPRARAKAPAPSKALPGGARKPAEEHKPTPDQLSVIRAWQARVGPLEAIAAARKAVGKSPQAFTGEDATEFIDHLRRIGELEGVE